MKGGVLVGRTHRELIAIELAQRHDPCRREIAHDRRIKRRAVAFQHLRAGGARKIPGDEDVLVRHRDTEQGRRVACCDSLVGGARLGKCYFFVGGQVGSQRFMRLGAREEVFRGLDGGDFLRRQPGRQFDHGQFMQRRHSITFGTRNKPRSMAGALRWLASRLSGSLATSSRRRSATS